MGKKSLQMLWARLRGPRKVLDVKAAVDGIASTGFDPAGIKHAVDAIETRDLKDWVEGRFWRGEGK